MGQVWRERETDRLVEEGEMDRGRKSWRKLGCETDGEDIGKEGERKMHK